MDDYWKDLAEEMMTIVTCVGEFLIEQGTHEVVNGILVEKVE